MGARENLNTYLQLPQVKEARSSVWSSTFGGVRGAWEGAVGWKNFSDESSGGYCHGMSLTWIHYMHRQWLNLTLSAVPTARFSRVYKGRLATQAKARHSSQGKMSGGPADLDAWVDKRAGGGSEREEFGALLGWTGTGAHTTALYGRAGWVYFYDSNYVAYSYKRSHFKLADHVAPYFSNMYAKSSVPVTNIYSGEWGWPD